MPDTTKASPIKKTIGKASSTNNTSSAVTETAPAAPSPDDAIKIGQLKEVANTFGQGYLKDTFTSKNRALLA